MEFEPMKKDLLKFYSIYVKVIFGLTMIKNVKVADFPGKRGSFPKILKMFFYYILNPIHAFVLFF